MRDDHLMQEKIEVSLERRHVALLAACALVLLGGVFALGVLVGRQLASSMIAGPQKSAAGDLSALDAEREDPAPSARPAPPSRPQHAAPPPSAGRSDAPAPATPAPTAHAAAAVAAASIAGEAAETPPPGPVAVIAPAKVATIQAGKPAAKPSGALTPPPRDLGLFTVQLGASQDRAEAQRIEARARAAGLRPYVIEANLGSKGVWYRVRVGAFGTREAADHFRKDADRELRGSTAVMPSR
ncbi:MAG: hypothetical protein NVSMB23_00260 [Myxococcales bacterium]